MVRRRHAASEKIGKGPINNIRYRCCWINVVVVVRTRTARRNADAAGSRDLFVASAADPSSRSITFVVFPTVVLKPNDSRGFSVHCTSVQNSASTPNRISPTHFFSDLYNDHTVLRVYAKNIETRRKSRAFRISVLLWPACLLLYSTNWTLRYIRVPYRRNNQSLVSCIAHSRTIHVHLVGELAAETTSPQKTTVPCDDLK